MPKGQTFIFDTALLSSDSGFYIRPSQSHSRHTMVSAQQDQVSQLGRTAISPVPDVVTLAVARWAMTARESTAAIAQVQRAEEWGGDQAVLATEVEKFALRAQDRGDEHAVAGVDAGFGGGDGAEVAEDGSAAGLGCRVEGALTGSGLGRDAGGAECSPADAGPGHDAEGGLTGSRRVDGAGVAEHGAAGAGLGRGAGVV